mgnify:CR=1 FL=1
MQSEKYKTIFKLNQEWLEQHKEKDDDFFKNLYDGQNPDFLYIGCSDSRVPANTKAKVLIENLRMVGEKPSSVKNPVIHAGAGTLAVQGEVKSGEYLWYQGGGKVGVYDKNWNLQAELPAVATSYEVDKGFSEFWIEGRCANPPPWFNVQFITKGEVTKIENMPASARK